jgi:hypothetical protein
MNRNLGRLPDLPGFPGNVIRSSASASDTFQRSINDQKIARKDRGGTVSFVRRSADVHGELMKTFTIPDGR